MEGEETIVAGGERLEPSRKEMEGKGVGKKDGYLVGELGERFGALGLWERETVLRVERRGGWAVKQRCNHPRL